MCRPFTPEAEVINGRLGMVAFALLILVRAATPRVFLLWEVGFGGLKDWELEWEAPEKHLLCRWRPGRPDPDWCHKLDW